MKILVQRISLSANFKKICCILTVIILASCNGKKSENNSIPVVDIEANYDNIQKVSLSRFADNISYVPLTSEGDNLLRGVVFMEFYHDMILISDRLVCLLFSPNGKSVTRIGMRGRGPGEYPYINNIGFNPEGKIYIQSIFDLYEYNQDGTFLHKYTDLMKTGEGCPIQSWITFRDSLFLAKMPNCTGKEKISFAVFNSKGDISYSISNTTLLETKGDNSRYTAQLYCFEDEIHYKERYNDTILSLTRHFSRRPLYYLHLGQYMPPYVNLLSGTRKVPNSNFCYIYNVYETPGYLFLETLPFNHPYLRRPQPLNSGSFQATQDFYYSGYLLGIYNKNSKEFMFGDILKTDNPASDQHYFYLASGISNDIDAGPRFFPYRSVNDSTMVMWLYPRELIDHIKSDYFIGTNPKDLEKKKELEVMVNKLNEFDNPVLMFVTFKNSF
jgi:hypothetical protein